MKRLLLLLIAAVLAFTTAACDASRMSEDGGAASGDAGGARVEASGGIPNGNTAGDAAVPSGGDFRAAPGGVDNAKAAVVDDFLGDVTAVSDGKDMPAFKGLALLRRDSLGTGAESWSSLELTEDRYVLVEENSDVQISQLADDAKNAEISLSAGKIWVIITDKLSDDENFEIKTPTCSLSVRGTVFSVSCDADGSSRVAVYEGTVRFTANDENGNEVSFDVIKGVADVITGNGSVADIRQSDLTDADLAVFREGDPVGPGGVYDILRSHVNGKIMAAINSPYDLPDGYHIYGYGSDVRYEGYWKNGMPNGEGTYYMYWGYDNVPPHVVSGTFFDGYPHGTAQYTAVYMGNDGYITETKDVTFDMGYITAGEAPQGGWGITPWTPEAQQRWEESRRN